MRTLILSASILLASLPDVEASSNEIHEVSLRWGMGVGSYEIFHVTSNTMAYCRVYLDEETKSVKTNAARVALTDAVLLTLNKNIHLPSMETNKPASESNDVLPPVTEARRGRDGQVLYTHHGHFDGPEIVLEFNSDCRIIAGNGFDPTVLRVIKCIQSETNGLTKKLDWPKQWLKDYVRDY